MKDFTFLCFIWIMFVFCDKLARMSYRSTQNMRVFKAATAFHV